MAEPLKQILDRGPNIDDDMPPEDFDPAQWFADVRAKIGQIKYRIDQWESDADMLTEKWIKPLIQRRDSMRRKATKLLQYLHQQMLDYQYEKLPSDVFYAKVQKSPPALKIDREPYNHEFLADVEDLIIQHINYEWNKEKLKKILDAGATLPFARIEQGTHIRFYVNKGDAKV